MLHFVGDDVNGASQPVHRSIRVRALICPAAARRVKQQQPMRVASAPSGERSQLRSESNAPCAQGVGWADGVEHFRLNYPVPTVEIGERSLRKTKKSEFHLSTLSSDATHSRPPRRQTEQFTVGRAHFVWLPRSVSCASPPVLRAKNKRNLIVFFLGAQPSARSIAIDGCHGRGRTSPCCCCACARCYCCAVGHFGGQLKSQRATQKPKQTLEHMVQSTHKMSRRRITSRVQHADDAPSSCLRAKPS